LSASDTSARQHPREPDDDAAKLRKKPKPKASSGRFSSLAIEMGGTISGEHGIGIMKSEFLPMALDPDLIAAMKRIKTALDPNNILNPERSFREPDAGDRNSRRRH